MRRVTFEPLLHIVVKKLFGPDHAGQGLTLNLHLIKADIGALDCCIEGIGFGCTPLKSGFKTGKGGIRCGGRESQPQRARSMGGDLTAIPGGGLGAFPGRIDGIGFAIDHMAMKGVLDIGAIVGPRKQPLGIGVVVGKQQLGLALAIQFVGIQKVVAGCRVGKVYARPGFGSVDLPEHRPVRNITHGTGHVSRAPGVAKPDRGQHIQRGRLGAAVKGGYLDQYILGACLGIFYRNIEIALVIEDARVRQLIFEIVESPATVFGHQIRVWKRRVRIF